MLIKIDKNKPNLKKKAVFNSFFFKNKKFNQFKNYKKKKIIKSKKKRLGYIKLKKFKFKKYKNKYTQLFYFYVIKSFLHKKFKRLKKILHFSLKKKVSKALNLKDKYLKKVVIRVTQNNIFCTFVNLKKKKTLHLGSSGLYKIQISKRKLKHIYKEVINLFFDKIQNNCRTLNRTIFNVIAPIKKIRLNICKIIKIRIKKKFIKLQKKQNKKKQYKKKKNILVNIVPKKCFNGCRVKKKIKKKRRLYRLYK